MKTLRAKIKIRRDIGLIVKPECEFLDGKEFLFTYGWTLNEDSRYPGETAWLFPDNCNSPILWIASGDLIKLNQ